MFNHYIRTIHDPFVRHLWFTFCAFELLDCFLLRTNEFESQIRLYAGRMSALNIRADNYIGRQMSHRVASLLEGFFIRKTYSTHLHKVSWLRSVYETRVCSLYMWLCWLWACAPYGARLYPLGQFHSHPILLPK